MQSDMMVNVSRVLRRFSLALQFQITLAMGFLFCLGVSYFYLFQADPRFPVEQPRILWVGFFLSLGCAALGYFMRPKEIVSRTNLARGVQIVFLTWMIACSISAFVFVLAGFPDPHAIETYSLWRSFVDGFFESMSGFTTAGGSILPSVEVFPRSILMRRSLTHFIGGMGIAYMAMTFFRRILLNRSEVVNAEAEGPNIVLYDNDEEAIQSGKDFFKIYALITAILFVLLAISGWYFRITPYQARYDAIFDAINYAFSTMGTGGFGTYDTSAGLFMTEDGQQIIGGLRNPVSEWIIAIFMLIAGTNFGLWYELLFYRRRKQFKNKEFIVFIFLVCILVVGITVLRRMQSSDLLLVDQLRWVLFSVASIISTTGLANYDFSTWPIGAIALLMIAYFTGSCVGSTAGGIKILRLNIMWKYLRLQIHNLVNRKKDHSFAMDGVKYTSDHAAMIGLNIVLYFLIFLLGGTIVFLIINPVLIAVDGTLIDNNFSIAFQATIANLGNIGPTFQLAGYNNGPTGNFFAFNEAGKLRMSILMYFGRVGVLSLIFLFIPYKQQDDLSNDFASVEFQEGEEGHIYLKK